MNTEKDFNGATFSTLDAYVAAFLSISGHTPKLVDQGGKIAFIFHHSESLRRSLQQYTGGAVVCAHEYAFEVKSMKSRIHEMRRGRGERHDYSRYHV